MKKWIPVLLGAVLLCTACCSIAEENPKEDPGFMISEITDEVFARIYGKSFKEDCTLPREDLRYLRVLHAKPAGRISPFAGTSSTTR